MLLSIKEMELRKLPFAQTFAPGAIDFSGSGLTQSADLRAEGTAELLPHTAALHSSGDVRVAGRLRTEITFDCDRCLGPARQTIDAPFDLFYKPAATTLNTKEPEVAIDEGEAEMGFYEMPGLELEDILREQVLMSLPMQRVCGPGCKGICPVCGGNRNENPCTCETHPANDQWAALKNLHIETK
jgi:uncharacterized protein